MARWRCGAMLGALGALLLLSGCTNNTSDPPGPPVDIGGPPPGVPWNLTIVYTNDIHGQILPFGSPSRGGLARHATLSRLIAEQAASRGAGLLMTNAGDNFEGTLFHEVDGGAFLFRLLDTLGVDICQIGNHDHQFGVQRLHDVIVSAFPALDQRIRFLFGNVNPATLDTTGLLPQQPVTPEVVAAFENGFIDVLSGHLSATLMDPPAANGFLFNQSLVFQRGDVRIGVFGADTDEILYTGVPGTGGLFLDPSQTSEFLTFYSALSAPYASEMIAYLEDPDGNPGTDDGADLILCVSHLGIEADIDLAETAVAPSGRRIDVIVGGHSHTRLNTALPVLHAGGAVTRIVQAGARGEFVGRLDLFVDPAGGGVSLANCQLLTVDGAVPEDPLVRNLITAEADRAGGVNALFGDPFTTVIGQCSARLPGELEAPAALGHLAADAMLEATTVLGADAALAGSFVFRSDLPAGPVTLAAAAEVFPLHTLDRAGTNPDTCHLVDFPGGLVDAPNLAALLNPNQTPAVFLGITRFEYFLEVVFSLEGFIDVLSGGFGISLGGVETFIRGLQWSGVTFTVDAEGPLFQRIDPATIRVGGVPLQGNEGMDVRLALNAIIAEIALPFFQLALVVENPPASGLFEPLLAYDPLVAETGIALRDALAAHIADLGVLEGDVLRTGGGRVRTAGPDLYFDPVDAVVSPDPAPSGGAILLAFPLRNGGDTAVLSADVTVLFDPTPDRLTDNPDGYTDGITGIAENVLATVPVGAVPGFAAGTPGTAPVAAVLALPQGLPAGDYHLVLRIGNVVSADPGRPERVTANNGGLPLAVPFRVAP